MIMKKIIEPMLGAIGNIACFLIRVKIMRQTMSVLQSYTRGHIWTHFLPIVNIKINVSICVILYTFVLITFAKDVTHLEISYSVLVTCNTRYLYYAIVPSLPVKIFIKLMINYICIYLPGLPSKWKMMKKMSSSS